MLARDQGKARKIVERAEGRRRPARALVQVWTRPTSIAETSFVYAGIDERSVVIFAKKSPRYVCKGGRKEGRGGV